MRLKELNTDKYCFDFRKDNIRNLSDVINIIAKSNKTNKNNKEYIIDTLIALTELNRENKGKKYDKISKINDELLGKININNKKSEFDDFISGIDLIEAEDDDIIPDKKSYLEERYINNNILF